jgi:hypothetical protein
MGHKGNHMNQAGFKIHFKLRKPVITTGFPYPVGLPPRVVAGFVRLNVEA